MTASPSLRWPTLVFDLDGTLVDTIGLIVASYQHAFRTVLGHEEDEARIRAWIGRPLVRRLLAAAHQRPTEPGGRARHTRPGTGPAPHRRCAHT